MNAYELLIVICTITDTIITFYNVYKTNKSNDIKLVILVVHDNNNKE